MGRPEQRERQRKRAAATCQKLDKFLPPKAPRTQERGQIMSSDQSSDPTNGSESSSKGTVYWSLV